MTAIIWSRKTWFAFALLAALAVLGWWQRQPILAWYHVRDLVQASEEDREACAIKVAELDEAVVPLLLSRLHDANADVCANVQYALLLLAKKWGTADPRGLRLAERLNAEFDGLGTPGQEKTLHVLTSFLQQDGPRPIAPGLTKPISEIMVRAEKRVELRGHALLLAAELVECVQAGQWVDACREMAVRGLKDEQPATRVAALQLLSREAMRKDRESLTLAVQLLRDADPSVRRAALLAIASETDVAREESLLHLLHDDDPQVQYLCEMALRKRGLGDGDIRLARMISDKNPAVRMRVPMYFRQMPDLNLAAWVRQLSQDPEPAVRAAAVRAAGEYPHLDLAQRLREMAESDPAASVRQNARCYLSLRSSHAAISVDR